MLEPTANALLPVAAMTNTTTDADPLRLVDGAQEHTESVLRADGLLWMTTMTEAMADERLQENTDHHPGDTMPILTTLVDHLLQLVATQNHTLAPATPTLVLAARLATATVEHMEQATTSDDTRSLKD